MDFEDLSSWLRELAMAQRMLNLSKPFEATAPYEEKKNNQQTKRKMTQVKRRSPPILWINVQNQIITSLQPFSQLVRPEQATKQDRLPMRSVSAVVLQSTVSSNARSLLDSTLLLVPR